MLSARTRPSRPPPVPPKPNLQLTDCGDYEVVRKESNAHSKTKQNSQPESQVGEIGTGDNRKLGDFRAIDLQSTNMDNLRTPVGNGRVISNSVPSINTRPFVTEYVDETNNNNTIRAAAHSNTVEILEVPHKSREDTHSNGNQVDGSRSAQQMKAYYENNSMPVPLITSVSDNEEDVVEQVFIQSSDDQPPRTSTPTSSRFISSTSSSGASTNTDTSKTHQCVKSRASKYNISGGDYTDEDTLNTSRETEESRNTSGVNQSGCELIGIIETSDQSAESRDSTDAHLKTQIRDISDLAMKPIRTTRGSLYEENSTYESPSSKVQDLEEVTNSMRNEIESLKNQITNLTTKVSQLESQVEHQKSSSRLSTDDYDERFLSSNVASERLSPFGSISRNSLSKSTSTINRLAPQGVPNANHSMTYSRGRATGAIKSSTTRENTSSPRHRSSSRIASQPNSGLKTLRSSRVHSSTSSLHYDNTRYGSVSPGNRFIQSARQQTLASKPEPMSHASLLSLPQSTVGNSTLRKGFAVSGSITNLSQNESKLSCWPSMSNFMPTTHSAKHVSYDPQGRIVKMMLYDTSIEMRLPSRIKDDYNIDSVVESPEIRLKLDWVHGYRGRDCRSNIHFLPTGECAYFVASIVVLYNRQEKTQRHYLGHTESVRCMAVHPNKLIIASGQSAIANRRDKRPIVRIWNAVSLATLRVIGFNEDFDCSICCLAFSRHDQGATLAVVDESADHTITILDWQREKYWRVAEVNSGHDPVLAIDFHPLDKDCLIGVGRGTINFWDIRGSTLTKKAGLFDKYDRPKYVLCLSFNDNGDTITGDSNGNIIIWPRGQHRPGRVVRDAHCGGVFSILAMKDGRYLTGGRDRKIVEWDECFEPTGREAELPEHCGGVRLLNFAKGSQVIVGTLRNSILVGSIDTSFELILQGHYEVASALAVHPRLPCYLTGGFDEQLHLFDAKRHAILNSKCIAMPVCSAAFSPNGILLVVGSTDGNWILLDASAMDTVFTATDGSATITCVKFSPNGKYFSLGSSDSLVSIYETNELGNSFTRVGSCELSAPIKEIDWSEDSRYLQVQTMNLQLSFWRAQDCSPLDNEAILDDLKWTTHNCTIGFDVFGIWPEGIEAPMVNYCDKSHNGQLLASVNEVGSINVFKWPTCHNECLSQKFYGNVERFDVVRFLADDSKIIAVGSKCCAITEWIVEKPR